VRCSTLTSRRLDNIARMRAARPLPASCPTVTRRAALATLGAGGLPAWSAAPASALPAPLFDGMGSYRAADASASALARRYVAQGMVLAWGFNPAEAARSFEGALDHDPGCAAAAWGLAWALGPTINADMAAADAPSADQALRRARTLAPQAAPRWQALIDALSLRHPGPGRLDEEAYERRMRALAARVPRDADLAVLAAEALMNLHPYDWWTRAGRAQPWTGRIAALLEAAIALAPEHPGAHHYLVHLMETSPTPQRALASADRLTTLVPGSGHLLHMPAHIYVRLGRYADASAANERSIEADRRYLEQVDAQGAYRVGYVAHNHHFLWASASMEGRGQVAIAAADAAWPAACGPRAGDRSTGTLQHLAALPLYARVRFGRWQELLTHTRPPDGPEPYPLAVWHYARGTALARSGRLAEAREALTALQATSAEPALAEARVKNINAAATLVQIARLTLQADLAAVQGRPAEALPALRQAVELEDGLAQDEPHLWLAPTRHALGAGLLAAGQAPAAERVFRQDLRHYPDNGWSLTGLLQAQRMQRHTAAARETAGRLRAAWRRADVALPAARF
jgi:tetratricopeptide (TPR) repeat protein